MKTLPKVIKNLLEIRGLTDPHSIDTFLNPKLSALPSPDSMSGMEEAVTIIIDGLKSDIPILIWGDYDVDGTTATSLLVNFFRSLGKKVLYHIPNRITEGYGLNTDYFKNGLWKEIKEFIMITVDCGISNEKEIQFIQGIGGRVIITDHHQVPGNTLNCPILNPSQKKCGFNGTFLAGVGVAFYLAAGVRSGLAKRMDEFSEKPILPNLKSYLGFVALGTIADVVQLSETNRILVRGGMETFVNPEFVGIGALLTACEITNGEVTSEDIGFNIGPTINAAGRYGVGSKVVELFTEQDPKKARKLAGELKAHNVNRKKECVEGTSHILDILDKSLISGDKCIVVLGEFFEGIIGILASRLTDQFKVPAIVFTYSGENSIKGSARSVDGIDIHKALNECAFLLQRFGGHEMAAGMSMSSANFEAFRERFIEEINILQKNMAVTETTQQFDLKCPVEQIFNRETLKSYKMLEPFGPGNLRPTFLDNNVMVVACRHVGSNKEHIQLTIRGTYENNIKAIGFNLGAKGVDIIAGATIKIIFTPTINRFRESTTWQARILDIL